jgi:hypothetical protein
MKEVSVNLSGLTTGIGGSSILTNGGSAGGLTPPKRSERADSACAMLPGDNPTLNDLIGQLTSPDSTTSTYVDKRGSDLGPTPPTNEDLDSAYESYCESVENETVMIYLITIRISAEHLLEHSRRYHPRHLLIAMSA